MPLLEGNVEKVTIPFIDAALEARGVLQEQKQKCPY